MATAATRKAEAAKRAEREKQRLASGDPAQLTWDEYKAAARERKGSALSPTNLKKLKEKWDAANPASTSGSVNAKGTTPTLKEQNAAAAAAEKKAQAEAEAKKKNDLKLGTDINTINTNIDAMLKEAKQKIYNMKPAERLALANALNNAGIATPKIGEYNDSLVANYRALLTQAKNYNTQGKDIQGFVPKNFAQYLADQTSIYNQTSNTGKTPKSYTDTTVYEASRASNYINSEYRRLLGRDATSDEINKLTKQLTDAQKKNPDKVTVDSKGNRTVVQGLDVQGYLDGLIKAMPEFVKKEAGKTGQSLESVLSTARNNGMIVDKVQEEAWRNRLAKGEDPNTISTEIRSAAALGYPDSIKKIIQSGTDLNTILSPYKQYMSSILEVNPNSISLNDPALRMAIGKDGEMNLFDYQRALRKDNRWQYTSNARDSVASAATKILQDFGFKG